MPAMAWSSRRGLQVAVALAGIVPVGAGLAGVLIGARMADGAAGGIVAGLSLDSHVRYLSGLLLAIGLAFWSLIPTIERRSAAFRLLTAIVVVGGIARLAGLGLAGVPSMAMLLALVMELVVTPLLCLWQARVADATIGRR